MESKWAGLAVRAECGARRVRAIRDRLDVVETIQNHLVEHNVQRGGRYAEPYSARRDGAGLREPHRAFHLRLVSAAGERGLTERRRWVAQGLSCGALRWGVV